ncbi:isoprenoid synthase domain-containing protein [Xylariaceae sp. FL1272]|nr:isoprenoid synthase domain-containing protein [Xylariaceae sp. FL1272]
MDDEAHNGPAQDLVKVVQNIVQPFIRNLDYKPAAKQDYETLLRSSRAKSESMGIPIVEDSNKLKRLSAGVEYAALCYPGHPIEVQTYIAVFTLLVLCLDDHTIEGSHAIEYFHKRFYTGERQVTSVLEGLSQLIREAHHHWTPIAANLITTNIFAFVTATTIELKELVKPEAQVNSGHPWAYYKRCSDGLGDCFAAFTFPRALYPDESQWIQAIPDMAKYILLCNDIISFYKEEVVGDTDNYIHTVARYTGKSVVSVLEDVTHETEDAVWRIRQVLTSGGEGQKPYAQAWHAHEQGYVDFHVFGERYKLAELGLEW